MKKKECFPVKNAKCYPLLLKTFEENGGFANGEIMDEIIAAIGGELTRSQISKWFWYRWGYRIKKFYIFCKNSVY